MASRNPCKIIEGCILPTKRQVLAPFFLYLKNKNTVQRSAQLTSQEIIHFWLLKRIPCREERNVIVCITKLHNDWIKLQ